MEKIEMENYDSNIFGYSGNNWSCTAHKSLQGLKQGEEKKSNSIKGDYSLSDVEKKVMVLAVPLFYNFSDMNFLTYNEPNVENYKIQMRDGLKKMWDINNRDEALLQIKSLINLEQAEYLSEKIGTIPMNEKNNIIMLCNSTEEIYDKVINVGAYDLTRAITLIKNSVILNYITKEEASNFLVQIDTIATRMYDSYTEYFTAFLMGRVIKEFGSADIQEAMTWLMRLSKKRLRQIY